MANRIQFRRGTAAEASAANPVLADGELAYETDTLMYKIGDGVNPWNALAYRGLSGGVVLSQGTTFPTSPTFGAECYRTDLDEWYKYNGSTWTQI